MSNKWNNKRILLELNFSYNDLVRQFGDGIVTLIRELAALYEHSPDDIHALLTQNFENKGERITLKNVSYEQINEFFETKMKADIDARPPQNMYDKLKEIFGKNTDDAMTAYGDAKCISMIFVRRMLKDSRCEAFMSDVAIHYLSSKAKLAGIKPPYFWHSSKNCPIDFTVIENFISKIYETGERSLARQLAIYVGTKISSQYFVEGEVFA